MPSAYGHTNGHHLVNTNSITALTNGQTPSSMATSSTVSPHRHGGGGGGSSVGAGSHNVVVGHHPPNQPQPSQQSSVQTNEEVGIKEVWAHNLEDEFVHIRKIVQNYPYVAMDTEFPGVVAKPVGTFISNSEYLYQIMRSNITILKIIQIGLTFMSDEGKKPDGFCTWQFNFRFNLTEDMYAQESIELLQNSGIQFSKHDQDGIDPTEFAVLLIGSGVVLSDNIFWLSFHSGYDFGYLLKILTDQRLPEKETEFFQLLRIFFPRVYDLKYLMKSTKDLKGGLQEVAEQLNLVRKGPQHQAGSDSLLTGETFFKLKEMYFENDIEEKRYSGFIYGLETADTGKTEPDEDSIITTSTTPSSNTTTTITNSTGTTGSTFMTSGTRNTNNNINNSTSSNNNNNVNSTNGTAATNNNNGNINDISSSASGADDTSITTTSTINDTNSNNNNNNSLMGSTTSSNSTSTSINTSTISASSS